MTRRTSRQATGLFGLTLAGLMLAFPAVAAATTNEPIAQTGGMTTTLPLLGTTYTVAVTLSPVGDISGVALSPGGLTQTSSDSHVVKFSNAGGTASVTVRAGGDSLSIKARSTLAGLSGPGTWAANVFGPGTGSTVGYTVGNDGSGNPTLAIGAVTTSGGVTSAVVAPTSKSNDNKAWVFGGVTFTSASGYVKHLTIGVFVRKSDGTASLDITLSGRDKLKLSDTLAALAGSRTWTAHLCTGTAVSVTYHVDAATKSVVYDSSTGGTVTEKAFGNGFGVRFDGTWVGLWARLKANDDGTYKLMVQGASGFCDKGHGWGHEMGGFGRGWGWGMFDKGSKSDGQHASTDGQHTSTDSHHASTSNKHHG
jgi:hypothetical protein